MNVVEKIKEFLTSAPLDNPDCLRIVSKGCNKSTAVFTPGGEELKAINSIEIEKIDYESGIVHAVIRCEVRLG